MKNRNEKVLLIEDSKTQRLIVRQVLDKFNSPEVISVNDIFEAYAALNVLKDVWFILADYKLPIADLDIFLEKIKQTECFKHIPVVVMSVKGNIGDYVLEVGCDAFVKKPITEEELEDVLRNKLKLDV